MKTAKKHAKVTRMPKSNKRMKRHYDMGGDVAASMNSFNYDPNNVTGMPDTTLPGMPDLSGTQMPVINAARRRRKIQPKVAPAQDTPEITTYGNRTPPYTGGGQPYTEDFSGYLKSRPTVAQARQAAYQNEMDALKALGGTAFTGATLGFGSALLGGAGAGAVGMGEGAEGVAGAGRLANMQRGLDLAGKWRKGRDIAEKLWRARTGAETAAEHQATRPIQDIIRERVRSGMGYKKGGKIHKTAAFNKGGHIRGSGCEMKGKTKGRVR